MSVYVDEIFDWGQNANWRYKGSCHLFCFPGDLDELHALAAKIGLKRQWFQNKYECPHYDLTKSKRTLAIVHGAIDSDYRKLGEAMKEWRVFRGRQEDGAKLIEGLL